MFRASDRLIELEGRLNVVRHAVHTISRGATLPAAVLLSVAVALYPTRAEAQGVDSVSTSEAGELLSGGLALGMDIDEAQELLGPADVLISDSTCARRSLLVFVNRAISLSVDCDGILAAIEIWEGADISVGGQRAGQPATTLLNAWGEPSHVDSTSGAAVWMRSEATVLVYLAPDGSTISRIEARRREPATDTTQRWLR